MASKLTLWHKAGRFITGVVVLAFFLPFFGVSCGGMDVITVSGADMVGGCRPGGMISEAADEVADSGLTDEGGGGGGKGPKIDKVDREPLAIIALALAVISFGLAWVRSRNALVGALVVSLAGIGALGGLYVKVSGDMKDGIEKEIKKEAGPGKSKEVDMAIESGGRMGLWLAFIAFASVAGLTGAALRERQNAPGGPGAGYPPAYPPPGAPPGGPPPGAYGT
jgi:hypothetical protein